MSYEDERGSRRHRIIELGPAWISAFAAVITALAAVGFFAGRATAPSGNPPAAAPTVTSSARPTPTASIAPSTSLTNKIQSPPKVYQNGSFDYLDKGSYYDLDSAESWGGNSAAGTDLTQDGSSLVGANGAVFAPVAQGNDEFSKCAPIDASSWRSFVPFEQLHAAPDICVTTGENRLGLLHFTTIPDPDGEKSRAHFRFVVWEKNGG